MSTATAFKYHRPFPFCLPVSGTPFYGDYVDATLADAMALFWNLENISFATTGTKSTASINWTNTLGATPSFSSPFTGTGAASGSYYDATSTPAQAPRNRVCNAMPIPLAYYEPYTNGSTSSIIDIGFYFRGSGNPSLPVRIDYKLDFETNIGTAFIGVYSPAVISLTGTPPSSGSVNVLGIAFPWIGGGAAAGAWATETVTISCTSSAFTY